MCIGLQSQNNLGYNIDVDVTAITNYYPIGTFDNRETAYKGSPLLWESFRYANILLEGNKMYSPREYHINYDIMSKRIYLRMGNDMHDLLLSKVNSLKLLTPSSDYVEYKVIRSDNADLGLYEILYTNENLQLLKGTDAQVTKAHYNIALDAGNVRPRLKRSETLYVYKADQLFELPRKRKKLAKYKRTKEIKSIIEYLNRKRVDLKDDDAVQSALIKFYKNK